MIYQAVFDPHAFMQNEEIAGAVHPIVQRTDITNPFDDIRDDIKTPFDYLPEKIKDTIEEEEQKIRDWVDDYEETGDFKEEV